KPNDLIFCHDLEERGRCPDAMRTDAHPQEGTSPMLRALRAAGAFSPRMGQTMDLILVKIFATALALSEVMTQPQAVKTHFDPMADQDQVVQTLRTGCAHMRRAFDIESINLDDLITTA